MARFPTGRTAFVVIHGIGEQNPFETLDGFARGLLQLFDRQQVGYKLSHRLRRHQEGGWTESFLRVAPKSRSKSFIDLHEVYWAYLTEGKISPSEMLAWLETTLANTRRYFAENVELIEAYERDDQIDRLVSLCKAMRWAAWAYPVAKVLIQPVRLFSGTVYEGLLSTLAGKFNYFLTEYFGDVAIYTTADRKSKFFNLRQRILRDSLEMLKAVLRDEEVEQVVLCGHSLGSVIAYDTLNRLQIEASIDGADLPVHKLKGLVTFGSPLDKIAFFFRQHAGKDQWLRRQILSQLHSFRARPWSFDEPPHKIADPVRHIFAELPWVNYWDRQDPVSGPLNLYDIAPENNAELNLGKPWGVAHVGYWGHVEMYEDLWGRFG
ncbi:MAG: hypothetical protein Kow00100_15070 [Geothermobacteraceae bacterium]